MTVNTDRERHTLRGMALLLLVMGTNMASAQSGQGPVSGDAERGRALYYDHACYSCHGYGGKGHNMTRNTPLSHSESGILASEALFITYLRLRAELNPLLPSEHMPNFGEETLSDAQARDIYAYIKTFKDDRKNIEDYPTMMKILEAADASGDKAN